ncbi:MAG: hypothetical protein WDM90_13085 [Ferruginibacter sp.]
MNRTWVLMHKLCNGKVPKLHEDILDDTDKALINDIKNAKGKIEGLLEEYKFREALFEVIDLSRKGNQYMQKKEPWIVAKKTTDNGPTTEAQQSIDNTLHPLFTVVCKPCGISQSIFTQYRKKIMLHDEGGR